MGGCMKIVRLMRRAVFILPALTYAQTPRDPRQMVQVYRSFADQYRTWLTMAFDTIPASKYGYRPTPAQRTIGNIAEHLENANYRLCCSLESLFQLLRCRTRTPLRCHAR